LQGVDRGDAGGSRERTREIIGALEDTGAGDNPAKMSDMYHMKLMASALSLVLRVEFCGFVDRVLK